MKLQERRDLQMTDFEEELESTPHKQNELDQFLQTEEPIYFYKIIKRIKIPLGSKYHIDIQVRKIEETE